MCWLNILAKQVNNWYKHMGKRLLICGFANSEFIHPTNIQQPTGIERGGNIQGDSLGALINWEGGGGSHC